MIEKSVKRIGNGMIVRALQDVVMNKAMEKMILDMIEKSMKTI